jgi:hypothetical protein
MRPCTVLNDFLRARPVILSETKDLGRVRYHRRCFLDNTGFELPGLVDTATYSRLSRRRRAPVRRFSKLESRRRDPSSPNVGSDAPRVCRFAQKSLA